MHENEIKRTDGLTIYLTMLEQVDKQYIEDILTRCAISMNIDPVKPIINIVNRYNREDGTYESICAFVNCMNTLLFKAILDLDDELNEREDIDEEHVNLPTIFRKKGGIIYDLEDKVVYRIYDPLMDSHGYPSNVVSAVVKSNNLADNKYFCDEIKSILYPYTPEPRIYFTKSSKGVRYINIKFGCVDHCIFTMPFLKKVVINKNDRAYVFSFTYNQKKR